MKITLSEEKVQALVMGSAKLAGSLMLNEHLWQENIVMLGLAAKILATKAKNEGFDEAFPAGVDCLNTGFSQQMDVSLEPVHGSQIH